MQDLNVRTKAPRANVGDRCIACAPAVGGAKISARSRPGTFDPVVDCQPRGFRGCPPLRLPALRWVEHNYLLGYDNGIDAAQSRWPTWTQRPTGPTR
ncbi:hypothetical protein GCM10020221_19800 [Streptomyces thioluteus]|uniref:Uncharacterized protein n=1 Tax=Streptomyces thioluteus TaxID=66431 RepID=A0ABN3WRN1_STRTU